MHRIGPTSKDTTPAAPQGRRRRWVPVLAVIVGAAMAGGRAIGAPAMGLDLIRDAADPGQTTALSALTVSGLTTLSTSDPLFPGGGGDVMAIITNPNAIPVAVTAVNLPTNTTYASGFTTRDLAVAQPGCSSTTSGVIWNDATSRRGSSHTLSGGLVLPPRGALVVTFTDAALMTTAAPAACENTYFSMPPLAGVTVTAARGAATMSPATDAWTRPSVARPGPPRCAGRPRG